MNNSWYKKGIILVIIVLFIGMSIIPSGGTFCNKSKSLEIYKENDSQPCFDFVFELYGLDAYASHLQPDENFGSYENIQIANEYGSGGSPGWADVAYIEFPKLIDLVRPPISKITNAELYFYYDDYKNTNPEGRDLNIYRVTDYWNENTITWNNQPTYESEPIAIAKVPSSVGNWIAWNVTNDVQTYLNEWPPDTHYGYRISDDSYWGETNIPITILRSRENEESLQPYLSVTIRQSKSLQTRQQSTSIPNSQNVLSVIPSSRNFKNDGSLLGYVNDTSGNPIDGALVRVYFHGTYEEDYSDSTGYYHVTNIPICYCLKNTTCSKEGYKTEWELLSIAENTTYDFILSSMNNPPKVPVMHGPTQPKIGVEYTYSFHTTDPDGDNVSYYIDWDDGTIEDWFGQFRSGEEVAVSKAWYEKGWYAVRCKAKDHPYEAESEWGTYLVKVPPKNKGISSYMFVRFLEHFPMLKRMLNFI